MPGKFLQNSASDFIAALGRLIWVRGGSESNRFARLHLAQFLAEQICGMLFDIDLLLEFHAVAHFHELVGITGVAIAAAELASAVGIDGPGKRHLALA